MPHRFPETLTDDQAACWQQWLAAVHGSSAVDVALRDLYQRLDAAVAEQPGVCELSGRCCHFDSYGHLLYVTGLEVAWLVGTLHDDTHAMLLDAEGGDGGAGGCPFQQNKLCSVHTVRPLGCRIYFCDPEAQAWQNAVYEQFLDELRALHERLNLPYRYIEWRAALAQSRQADSPAS
ncbi:MAG: hypothetical protein WD294_01155 [Phycisphaeraceae bacterium]